MTVIDEYLNIKSSLEEQKRMIIMENRKRRSLRGDPERIAQAMDYWRRKWASS